MRKKGEALSCAAAVDVAEAKTQKARPPCWSAPIAILASETSHRACGCADMVLCVWSLRCDSIRADSNGEDGLCKRGRSPTGGLAGRADVLEQALAQHALRRAMALLTPTSQL